MKISFAPISRAHVYVSTQHMAHALLQVDVYLASLQGNDRAILDGEAADQGFVKVLCEQAVMCRLLACIARLKRLQLTFYRTPFFAAQDTDIIVGATIVASRAGEMVNEITMAMQNGIGLGAVARVVHPYPTVLKPSASRCLVKPASSR